MDRKLHVDTLIFNSYVKIYVFWYSRWMDMDGWTDGRTDRLTDKQLETLIQGGLGNYVAPGKKQR